MCHVIVPVQVICRIFLGAFLMKISSFGGLIAAANDKLAFPLTKVGGTTAVRRIVANFRQAGIFPIVILSGAEEDEVRYQLSSSGVIFLHPEQKNQEMFESVKTGFAFLHDCCEKIVFTPVNTPMFSSLTLHTLMKVNGDVVSPSYKDKSGHPMVVSSGAISDILSYQGDCGLRGAVSSISSRRVWVNVDDDGILYTINEGDVPERLLAKHNRELPDLSVELKLTKGKNIFDSRAKLLLFLIWKNKSVSSACKQMALSCSKAWEILNVLEDSLQVKLFERKHGGVKGGHTVLSENGIAFLRKYRQLEEQIYRYSKDKFDVMKSVLQSQCSPSSAQE